MVSLNNDSLPSQMSFVGEFKVNNNKNASGYVVILYSQILGRP